MTVETYQLYRQTSDLITFGNPHLSGSNNCNNIFFLHDGSFATEDMFGFLTDGDFPALGKRPNTWHDCVIGLRDEMANHVVIQSAASLFAVNIHIIDWMGVS